MIHKSLSHLNHRPWPLPSEPWRWRQSWLDVGMMHYRVSVAELRQRVPSELEIDQFDGTAWVSIVPFRMEDVMKGNLPSFYPFQSFPELNLRTYVKHGDKRGVWFFSLDASSLPVVFGGRYLYGMPYHPARMSYSTCSDGSRFKSERWLSDVQFDVDIRSTGESFVAQVDSFEYWVTERYCLYAKLWYGGIVRVEVHHQAWPLMRAEFEVRQNDILKSAGIKILSDEVITHFSSGVEVISYAPKGIV